jgi:hypothetical protein
VEVKVIVLKVSDQYNTQRAVTCNDMDDTIEIGGGLKDNNGADFWYCDGAYYLRGICAEKGLTVAEKIVTIEI